MSRPDRSSVAILHYSAPPIVGGVEAVIQAHAQLFVRNGYPLAVIAGRGEAGALPQGAELVLIPEVDSRNPAVARASEQLARGRVPEDFDALRDRLVERLAPHLQGIDALIVHNVFTKHFNLPLTAALDQLLDRPGAPHCIAWCHDFTWTSPSSGSKVRPGYPWDLLRTRRPGMIYTVVSQRRQKELAGLLGCPPEEIHVVYNGVDPRSVLGLSPQGAVLVERLGLIEADLVLLMPVRVTQAKNIEYALRVVAALKEQGCRPKLVLTGPPDPHDADSMAYFQALLELRRDLGVDGEMRFVFELVDAAGKPTLIDMDVVGDLLRSSDLMFMPSHREGFAMPVLEAALANVPVVSTDVPAAVEIGGQDVFLFDLIEAPEELARRILAWVEDSPVVRLRRRVRQRYTWRAIFRRDIEPLLRGAEEA